MPTLAERHFMRRLFTGVHVSTMDTPIAGSEFSNVFLSPVEVQGAGRLWIFESEARDSVRAHSIVGCDEVRSGSQADP